MLSKKQNKPNMSSEQIKLDQEKMSIFSAVQSKDYSQLLEILEASENSSSLVNLIYKNGNQQIRSLATVLVSKNDRKKTGDALKFLLTHDSFLMHPKGNINHTFLEGIAETGDIESFKLVMTRPDIIYYDKEKKRLTYLLFDREARSNTNAAEESYKVNMQKMVQALRYISYHTAITNKDNELLDELKLHDTYMSGELENPLDVTSNATPFPGADDLNAQILFCNEGNIEIWKSLPIVNLDKNQSEELNLRMERLRDEAYLLLTKKIDHFKKSGNIYEALITRFKKKIKYLCYCSYQKATESNKNEIIQKLEKRGFKAENLSVDPLLTTNSNVSSTSRTRNEQAFFNSPNNSNKTLIENKKEDKEEEYNYNCNYNYNNTYNYN